MFLYNTNKIHIYFSDFEISASIFYKRAIERCSEGRNLEVEPIALDGYESDGEPEDNDLGNESFEPERIEQGT